MHPQDLIEKHFRLIPPQKAALKRLGIRTIRDLLYHFPSRYEQAGVESTARELVPGAKVTLYGTLSRLKAKKLWKSRRTVTEGWFEDASGRVKVMWFNQPYMASYVTEGAYVRLSGTIGGKGEKPYIANPEVEKISALETAKGLFAENKTDVISGETVPPNLFPVYPESRGITSRWFYHALRKVFAMNAHREIDDPIPEDTRTRLNLPDIATALVWIHTPEKDSHARAARKRFSFEEMFALQVARALERERNDESAAYTIAGAAAFAERFLGTLEYQATDAQRRAIAEIIADFGKPHPMARLLEGDVGSGKTLVAAAASYAAVNSRPPKRESGTLQVAYMAPTEILAQQHFESFIQYFRHLPISIALITGTGCKKFPSKLHKDKPTDISRAQLLKWVASGEIAMIVGTHALIQKSIQFQHLALAIVDEQHRFGTNQRKALIQRSSREKPQIRADGTPIDADSGFLYKDLSYAIRSAAFTVHNALGVGHKELVYQNALAVELDKRNISYERERQIDVHYENKKVGIYQPDFIIDDKIIVELKALSFTGPREHKQLWTYLKGSSYKLALLINFGASKVNVVRVVYDSARGNDLRESASNLRTSALSPHFLSMTATPIPRTLALTIYGDLDISVLDELPPGRVKISTKIIHKKERVDCYEHVRKLLMQGRQAYVICPRIEEPDPAKINALQAKSAKAEAARLKKEVFPEFEIGLVHGALKPKEKDAVMQKFSAGKIDILVATSVVEVGVNVPNATVILIEGAERFGLAQLHQLRGRVQRSSHPPYCYLLPETRGEVSMKRLKALEKSSDGFQLAEVDLETRGPGDLYGKQQWGISDLGMEALKNPRLIQAARTEAQTLVAEDATLSHHPALAERVANAGKELHGE